jgi:hypothetical protein
MATTENLYTGDGSTVLFSFTFPYLEESHIKVSLDGANTTAYTLANATTVEFNTAPAVGVAIRLYRDSDTDAPEATFFPGSAIRAADLNDNFLQSLYLNQETRRVAQEAALGGIPDGSIGTAKLATSSVTEVKLADGAVTEAKIGGSIGTTKLATAAVTTDKVADSAITQAKIGTNILTPTVSEINGGPLAGFRNAIINGNFDIWQRGASFANPVTGAGLTDRWLHGFDGSGSTRTISRQAFALGQTAVPGEPTYFCRYAHSVAGTGGTYANLQQRLESVRTFAGQQVTLSFYAMAASAITLPNISAFQTFGTGGSPSADVGSAFVSNLAIGTSWAKYSYTITLPSISGKTLGSDNNDYITIAFGLPINTTFTFDIAQVQIEPGPVATPFERRPIGTELALCQRYYWTGSVVVETVSVLTGFNFPVQMRALPTIAGGGAGFTTSTVGVNGWWGHQTARSGQTLTASAEL